MKVNDTQIIFYFNSLALGQLYEILNKYISG